MSNDVAPHTITVKRYTPTDPRLGRHLVLDSRSLAYLVKAEQTAALASVRHHSNIPPLDQLKLGSCTGNAGTKALADDAFWAEMVKYLSATDAKADETFAVNLYSDAEKEDGGAGLPSEDEGSSGLSIAKVLKVRGLISGYLHITSFDALLTALAKQTVMVGVEWYENMFEPSSTGAMDLGGAVAGGHEIVYDELDVERRRIWLHNSWNASWGVQGRAWLTYDQAEHLLMNNGDGTLLVPPTAPAPTPAPAPVSSKALWVPKAQAWVAKTHTGDNAQFAKDTKAYLTSL